MWRERRDVRQFIFEPGFTESADKLRERLTCLLFLRVNRCQFPDDLLSVSSRDLARNKTIRGCIGVGRTTQNNLEHRSRVRALSFHGSQEPDVGDMVMTARVEAAADLDLDVVAICDVAHAVVALSVQPTGEAPGRRDIQLAGVRSRTCRDVCQSIGPCLGQAEAFEILIQGLEVGV